MLMACNHAIRALLLCVLWLIHDIVQATMIFCGCNLPSCTRSEICRTVVGCFQELPPPAADLIAVSEYHGRIGCLELWPTTSSYSCVPAETSQNDFRIDPSLSRSTANNDATPLRCCMQDMCNLIGGVKDQTFSNSVFDSDFDTDYFLSNDIDTPTTTTTLPSTTTPQIISSTVTSYSNPPSHPFPVIDDTVILNVALTVVSVIGLALLILTIWAARKLVQKQRHQARMRHHQRPSSTDSKSLIMAAPQTLALLAHSRQPYPDPAREHQPDVVYYNWHDRQFFDHV